MEIHDLGPGLWYYRLPCNVSLPWGSPHTRGSYGCLLGLAVSTEEMVAALHRYRPWHAGRPHDIMCTMACCPQAAMYLLLFLLACCAG